MIWTRFHAWIMSLAGVLASGLAIYAYGRSTGKQDTKDKIERADYAKSRQIQDAADRARRAEGGGLSAADRLRKYRKLRDWSDDL